jgi:hypothetical protein
MGQDILEILRFAPAVHVPLYTYTQKKKKKKKGGRIYVNLYDVEALNSEPHGLMDFKESAMPLISFSSSAKLMLTFSLGFRPY